MLLMPTVGRMSAMVMGADVGVTVLRCTGFMVGLDARLKFGLAVELALVPDGAVAGAVDGESVAFSAGAMVSS